MFSYVSICKPDPTYTVYNSRVDRSPTDISPRLTSVPPSEPTGEHNVYRSSRVLTIAEQCEQSNVPTPSSTPKEDPTRVGLPPGELQYSLDLRMELFAFLWKGVKGLDGTKRSQ